MMKTQSKSLFEKIFKPETVMERVLVISVYTVVVIIATVAVTDRSQNIPSDEVPEKLSLANRRLSDENKELRMQNASLVSEMSGLSQRQVQPAPQPTPQPSVNQSQTERPAPPSASNINISDIDSSIIDYKDDSEYMDVSFKVKLTNNNQSAVAVRVKFTLKDKAGFLLREHIIWEPVYIEARDSKVLSDKDFMKKSIYRNTEKIGVEVELR